MAYRLSEAERHLLVRSRAANRLEYDTKTLAEDIAKGVDATPRRIELLRERRVLVDLLFAQLPALRARAIAPYLSRRPKH